MGDIPTFGEVYHTKDGKTIFIDPKTGQISVFEGILTIDKILEPAIGGGISFTTTKFSIDDIVKQLYTSGISDINGEELVVPAEASNQAAIDATGEENVLGPMDYYILVSSKQLPLSLSAARTSAWVSEYRNGHHPEYPSYKKYQILPEQWKWLINDHKQCPIMAWYDIECPAFVTLACQAHAKVIGPVRVFDEKITTIDIEAPATEMMVQSGHIDTSLEHILAEERDV